MVEEMFNHFQLRISKTSICNHLDKMMYTLKAVRFEPERCNSLENKQKRKEFVEQLLAYQGENRPIIFMDESNFNLHISRQAGRSLQGSRCSTLAAASRGANIHIIAAISSFGLVYHKIKHGAFKKVDAIERIMS